MMISGPSSLYVLGFNGKLFVFFGEYHQGFKNNCQEKYNVKCDEFDYGFEKSVIYDGNCWTIGTLLDEWFTYNNHMGIKTDFYFETAFTKGDVATWKNIISNIEYRRSDPSYKSMPPDLTGIGESSIGILTGFFSECLKQTKQGCKYNPNVKLHYADLRYLNVGGEVSSISLYSIYPYIDLIKLTNRNLIPDIDSIFSFYNTLLDINLITDLYLSNIDIRTTLNNIQVPELTDNVQNAFNNLKSNIINNASQRNGILMTRVAAEFNRLLSLHPDIANKLYDFIIMRFNTNKIVLLEEFEELYSEYLDEKNKGRRRSIREIISIAKYLDQVLGEWNHLTMDIYTISRMFIQESQQIIAYAGDTHTLNYVEFIKYLGGRSLVEHPSAFKNPDDPSTVNQCVPTKSSSIPNINDFRRIYKIVNYPELLVTNPTSSVQLITFNEAKRKLNAGDFLRFDFLPEYQTIPHKSGNHIATFYGRGAERGNIYLTELQYKRDTNEIFPPL